jgi:hypothetical protein
MAFISGGATALARTFNCGAILLDWDTIDFKQYVLHHPKMISNKKVESLLKLLKWDKSELE